MATTTAEVKQAVIDSMSSINTRTLSTAERRAFRFIESASGEISITEEWKS